MIMQFRVTVANNFKNPGAMWAPNWTSFTSQHWYFGAQKVESNPSQVPVKSDKILTRHVGDKILKILSPKDKITRICKWGVVICNPTIHRIRMTMRIDPSLASLLNKLLLRLLVTISGLSTCCWGLMPSRQRFIGRGR